MSLEDIYIEKSFKYIRKVPDGKGGWKYIYEEPMSKNKKQGGFGEIFDGYKGKPKKAFDKLLRERRGQCQNVCEIYLPVYIDEGDGFKIIKDNKTNKPILAKTSIDFVWGDKNRNVGLEHIIDDHYVIHDDFDSIEELQNTVIDELLRIDYFDKNNKEAAPNRVRGNVGFRIITPSGQKFVFAVQKDKDSKGNILVRHFILTSYDKSTPEVENSKEERERRQKIFDSYVKEKPKR